MIEILQLEDSTRQTLSEMTSTTQKIHYASYEKKKGTGKKQKFQSNSNVSSSSSSRQKQDSTGSQKVCFCRKKNYTKGNEKVYKVLKARCYACGIGLCAGGQHAYDRWPEYRKCYSDLRENTPINGNSKT